MRAAGPVAMTVVGLFAWEAVAHNSGSGWVQALGGLLAGFAVVGMVGPGLATARLRVEVAANPGDATAGRPVGIELRASAPLRVREVAPGSPTATLVPGIGVLELIPARRGRVDTVTVAVSSAAPFGLLWWQKRLLLPLARPLWVAPLAADPDPVSLAGTGKGVASARHQGSDARIGDLRAVRPYSTGDPRRLVHWPASAHSGSLMVRELEQPDQAAVELVVALPDNGPDGDAVAAHALGTLLALGAAGTPVVLTTLERDGPVRAAVAGPADAGRRLARAVAPPVGR